MIHGSYGTNDKLPQQSLKASWQPAFMQCLFLKGINSTYFNMKLILSDTQQEDTFTTFYAALPDP